MSSRSPSNQENVPSAAAPTSNNMNSKVNKLMGQLPENLRLNGKTPSGKPRLFVCQICTRAFARQEHLTRHERSHTKEKPYSCGICNRNFSRRDLLLRHANKIHGGNFGDTIIKHNKGGASKVAKRRQSAGKSEPSGLGTRSARRPDLRAHSTAIKRRASFSAQSGEYVAPVQNQENHKFDRVRFSTPELLPIDLKEIRDESYSQDVKSDLEDLYLERNDSNMPQAGAQVPLGSPNDFNLLDSVNWINDYNNEPYLPTSETGTVTETAKTRTGTTNSANISPDSNHATFSLEAALANGGTGMNIRSSWSIDEAGGNLQVKSLFNTVSPSSSSKDNSVLPNSSAANSTPWLRSSSELVTNNDSKKSPSFSRSATVPGGFPEKHAHLHFEENVGLLHNCLPYEQSNLEDLKETEELQNFEPIPIDHVSLLNHFESRQIEGLKSLTDAPDNDYTAYGLDHLTLSHITRATSRSNEERFAKLPNSDIFSPELRQMCIDASRYYDEHYYDNYAPGTGTDRTRISKGLLLPSCRELNMYVSYFREFFNSHHPVIHPDFFNLNMKALKSYVHEGYTVDEESDRHLQYSNVVCLPLFVATVGSLFKPEPDANTRTLYETSRRVLHVFLERTKEQQQSPQGIKPIQRSGQHVWLIQSLSLSIFYSLFADHMGKINAEMIKRQVSAVCSIIKNNFLAAISYDTLTGVSGSSGDSGNQGIFQSGVDTSFSYIMFESKIRCALSAYKFCQFLRIFYNVEAKLFLSEQDIEPICIPDDENTWNKASLLLPQQPMTKSNVTSFRKFYDSFTFNHSGMKPIPESLASIMLYYEFNISTHSTFHVFLTRIDTKKLEKNLAQIQSQLNLNDLNGLELDYTSILKSDSIVLRNCLMTMYFLLRIDRNIGSKFWQGRMNELFDSFINPRSMTILSKGSYSLLSDFLVALNSSIKNLTNVFKLNDSKTSVYLNNKVTSMFNLQAYHNDFLVLLKFIMDFEYKPNFKLLCIFTELKRLADRLLIPFLSQKYPLEFTHFEDVSMTNNFIQQNADFFPKSFHHYSSINVEELEKLINNVLVYSFNDSSFLKMSEQLNNEFPFNSDHPTYDPFDFSMAESVLPSEATGDTSHSEMAQEPSDLIFDESEVSKRIDGQDKREPTLSKSFTELLSWMPDKQNLDHLNNVNGHKQGFAERYRLSEKYVVIAKCFFTFVRERYVNCQILDRMTNDFKELQMCLAKEKERYQASATKLEDIYKGEDVSHLNSISGLSAFDRVSTS
ncbi:hypothetical protein HG536_0C00300 [Torulaspora globosa]|uniref:C2H2-type domain-containing protein n=1 Tax=Torulaspora globosa TaxID=48254 RepID=A0A7G3ZEC7_9SACH|nr:uncharacterized protein HG536_0C00300 [Torulaspora globosa]QLL31863.1 hypothetical protein HG536_0C00300 [Torulaspora globosa]